MSSLLIDLITSYRKSAALYTLVNTGMSILVNQSNGSTIIELANGTGISEERVKRLLEYLVILGVTVKKGNKYYFTKECKSLNDSDSKFYKWVQCELSPEYWNSWSSYPSVITSSSNKSAFEIENKSCFFKYLENNEILKSKFDTLMASFSAEYAEEFLTHYPILKYKNILDIGGGNGAFLSTLAVKFNDINFTVLDTNLEELNVQNVAFISGDFFEYIPDSYDLYIMKNILHDWSDDNVIKILTNCRSSMSKHDSLLVIESIKESDDIYNVTGKSLDILMDVLMQGKERSIDEYCKIFQSSGLKIKRIVKTKFPQSIIELNINND